MRLHSLKARLILPLLVVSCVAASLVAIVSYWMAQRATASQLDQRFTAIRRSIEQTNFPLSRGVLLTLSELTSASWVTLGAGGEVLEGRVADSQDWMTTADRERWAGLLSNVPAIDRTSDNGNDRATILKVSSKVYHVKRFRMANVPRRTGDAVSSGKTTGDWRGGGATVHDVVVMFDDVDWRDMRLQAAAAPLVTGLSTILLISSVALFLAGRLVLRLKRLQREVEAIAQGNFSSQLAPGPEDEIGRLGMAVETMAMQLKQMWDALGRQHGQRLLHQIAAGLAHNLRNTLTGARMAVELHAQEHQRHNRDSDPASAAIGIDTIDDGEGLRIAIQQLEQAEDYVRRLLLVSKGKQDVDRPATVGESLRGVIDSLGNTAKHLGVGLNWSFTNDVDAAMVADGPTLTSAVTNLVWNGLQAGKHVDVNATIVSDGHSQASLNGSRIQINVVDDGPGPSPDVVNTLFEPLVTTKPEGLGLGLPLVKRAAESLGGDVGWQRRDQRTVFTLQFPAAVCH